jgi:hypothetical protein
MKTLAAILLLFAVALHAATDIQPKPSDPGNLGATTNRFPKVIATDGLFSGTVTGSFVGPISGDASGASNVVAAAVSGTITNNTTGNAATATTANTTATAALVTGNGSLSSTNFSGNGSGLTNLNVAIRLSDYMASDTVLNIGNTNTGVDRSALIQSLLNRVTNYAGMTLYWDVAVSGANLFIRSNTAIYASPGCGMRLLPNANSPLISNFGFNAATNSANWTNTPDLSAIAKDENIVLNGGIWDGNKSWQQHDTATNGWVVGMRFFNVKNLHLENVQVNSAKTFAYHIFNSDADQIINCRYDMGTNSAVNTDGLHYHASKNITIKNFTAHGSDDAIGLNADDLNAYAGYGSIFGPYAAAGPITGVNIDGLNLHGSYGTNWTGSCGIRILSGTNRIDGVTIRNINGRYNDHILVVGNFDDSPTYLRNYGPGNIGKITIDGVDVVMTGMLFGKQASMYFCGRIENLTMRNTTLAGENGDSRPFLHFKTVTGSTCSVASLTMDNIKFIGQTNTAAPVSDHIRLTGATIGTFNLNNVEVLVRDRTNRYGALITVNTASQITNLTVNGLKSDLLHQVVSGTNVQSVSIRNSNVPELMHSSGAGKDYVQVHPILPNTLNLFSPASAGVSALWGGEWIRNSNCTFSVLVKNPDPWNGSSPSIGTRLTYWPIGGGAMNGYSLGWSLTGVTLYSVTAGSYTSLTNRSATLIAGDEYRIQIKTYGDVISGYVQQLSDDAWLAGDGAFTAGRKPCIVWTNSTYTANGLYNYVSQYSTTTNTPLRIREMKVW